MSEKKPQSQQELTEAQITYAYEVFNALNEAFDRVAAKPELARQLLVELTQKMPEIFEALMAVTQPDHRLVIYQLIKSAGRLLKQCLAKKT